MRDYKGAIDWYRKNETTAQIGFNPDGMCLKICRVARGIDSMYPSAVVAQHATPTAHRVLRVRDLRRGMVLYYDDANDENPYGHVVTMIGRVKGFDPDKLSDILVETNSVKRGEVVTVRGDYFPRYWGDEFKFGATWLNGKVLDIPTKKSAPPKDDIKPPEESEWESRVEQFRRSGPDWDVKLLDQAIKKGRVDLRTYVDRIEHAVSLLPDDEKNTMVEQFKTSFAAERVLEMWLLNEAIKDGRQDAVKKQRDRMWQVIKSLPDR